MKTKFEWKGIEIVKRDLTDLICDLEEDLESVECDDDSKRLELSGKIERAKHYFYLADIMEDGMGKLNTLESKRVELS